MNNKSFHCQRETAQRNGQKPQWESKKCIFDWFQLIKGMKVRRLSNSVPDYCGLLGIYENHMGYLFHFSKVFCFNIISLGRRWVCYLCYHRNDVIVFKGTVARVSGRQKQRHWPLLWHSKPVLVLLALLGILLHGCAGIGNKCLLHGLPHPQTQELVRAMLLPLCRLRTWQRKFTWSVNHKH